MYRRERSAVWQCRYSVDGRWQRTSTHERELKLARRRAHDILVEANVRKKMNAAPITRFFRDVARSAVARMQKELAAGNGKVIFKDYISTIQKYLIPFFGKHKIDSVDYQLVEQFSAWRDKRMEKRPRRSTLLNHNAALNRVFDEAVIRGFMVESNRPKLVAKGKKSERRPDFSLEEVRALRTNFDAWIAQARTQGKALRADASGVGTQPHGELLQRGDAACFGPLAPVLQVLEQLLAGRGGTLPDHAQLATHVVHRLQGAVLFQRPRNALALGCGD